MVEVEITETKIVKSDEGDLVVFHGTVEGHGYRLTFNKATLDKEASDEDRRKILAKRLLKEHRRYFPKKEAEKLNLVGKTTVSEQEA